MTIIIFIITIMIVKSDYLNSWIIINKLLIYLNKLEVERLSIF